MSSAFGSEVDLQIAKNGIRDGALGVRRILSLAIPAFLASAARSFLSRLKNVKALHTQMIWLFSIKLIFPSGRQTLAFTLINSAANSEMSGTAKPYSHRDRAMVEGSLSSYS